MRVSSWRVLGWQWRGWRETEREVGGKLEMGAVRIVVIQLEWGSF